MACSTYRSKTLLLADFFIFDRVFFVFFCFNTGSRSFSAALGVKPGYAGRFLTCSFNFSGSGQGVDSSDG